jgi:hypothetical protein
MQRPNTGFQLTPLGGRKIVAILAAGISSTAFPTYEAAQLKPSRWARFHKRQLIDNATVFQYATTNTISDLWR